MVLGEEEGDVSTIATVVIRINNNTLLAVDKGYDSWVIGSRECVLLRNIHHKCVRHAHSRSMR